MIKMSNQLIEAIKEAKKIAIKYQDSYIRVEHITYIILKGRNIISSIINGQLDNNQFLLDDIDALIKEIRIVSDDTSNVRTVHVDPLVNMIVEKANEYHEKVEIEHFILGLYDKESALVQILNRYGITKVVLERNINKMLVSSNYDNDKPESPNMTNKKQSKTPTLDLYGRDLTAMAIAGKLDPVIGRDAEVERITQILSRKNKRNAILLGFPGSGKSAIVEGLAIRIALQDCPPSIQNKRIVELEISSVVAGTKYRGQFEERMKAIMEELKENRDVILFIDEMHTIVGAGNGSGALDASNILKPALSRGEFQCIGATTLDEYRMHIEKDGALERRFQKVIVNPTTISETLEILKQIKSKYEGYHSVVYTDEALSDMVMLADRYITTREFPDKAIDILDECGARAQLMFKKPDNIRKLENDLNELNVRKMVVVKSQQFEEAAEIRNTEKTLEEDLADAHLDWKKNITSSKITIGVEQVAEVVSLMSGVPITKATENEVSKLLNLENELSKIVIGQEEAIKKVVGAIKRSKTGVRRTNTTISNLFLCGNSGVGKSELAKTLAKIMFGSEDALIRIDMSEYDQSHTVSKLIGAPPGFVGYEEGGQLTEKVRNKPYSVILFDEIEKAHPKVYDIFLQMMDDGHLTDGLGRKINFKNCIIIMTSNVGASDAKNFATGIGFTNNRGADPERRNEIITKALKKQFKPEFLNRLSDIVYFNNLTEENMLEIVKLQLHLLIKRLSEGDNILTVGEGVAEYLVKNGYDEEMGAREIQRTIQKFVEDPISDALLLAGLPEKVNINLSYDIDNEKITVNLI